MKATDKTKRLERNNSQDRFYVGDVIKNKITNKVLKVNTVVNRVDGNGILFYWLCDIDDEFSSNRTIPQEAVNHWELAAQKSIQPDYNITKVNGAIMLKTIVI